MENYHLNLESEASASSKPTNLKLVFLDDVASPVFTKEKITGKGKTAIRINLVDSNTQQIVTTGPPASAKVKLVLVHGSTPLDNFTKSIVVNWKKKKNLLLGNLNLDLKHGSGTIGEIRIKHDRFPLSNVRFRLGAMVIDCPGFVIEEAVTNIFDVKDRRNVPKYTGPLSATDEVWHLKNIRKKGPIHKRLQAANISTVSDFLNMYYSEPQALQEICRIKGKKWEAMIDHAKTCLENIVGNAYRGVGSTSQPSNTVPSLDSNGSIEFDRNCYKREPLEDDDRFNNGMIYDWEFSTQDVELCHHVYFHGPAKKRWMKLRTLWFSITSFMNKCKCVCP